jgi:alpha-1,3-rhamnosyl/mannosyltransferase
MAAGCPVLIADTPALVEVAADAALVFDADGHGELAELMRRVLADRVLRAQMIDAGRLRARDLSWRRTAASTADAYRMILAQS